MLGDLKIWPEANGGLQVKTSSRGPIRPDARGNHRQFRRSGEGEVGSNKKHWHCG